MLEHQGQLCTLFLSRKTTPISKTKKPKIKTKHVKQQVCDVHGYGVEYLWYIR